MPRAIGLPTLPQSAMTMRRQSDDPEVVIAPRLSRVRVGIDPPAERTGPFAHPCPSVARSYDAARPRASAQSIALIAEEIGDTPVAQRETFLSLKRPAAMKAAICVSAFRGAGRNPSVRTVADPPHVKDLLAILAGRSCLTSGREVRQTAICCRRSRSAFASPSSATLSDPA